MEQKKTVEYRYPSYVRLFCHSFNCLGFLFLAYGFGRIAFKVVVEDISMPPDRLVEAIFYILFAWVVIILTANFFPDITADQEGLQVSFVASPACALARHRGHQACQGWAT